MKSLNMSLNDIENLIPYEKEIYISLLAQFIEKKNKEMLEHERKRI
jgi:hypothetical protein